MRRKTAKVGRLLTEGPVAPHGIYRSDRSVQRFSKAGKYPAQENLNHSPKNAKSGHSFCILVRHIASYGVLQYAYALRVWLTFRW